MSRNLLREERSETRKEIKTETIDNLKDAIERIVLTFDAVELLACLSSLWYFVPENKVPSDTTVERGHLHYLTGLFLKNGNIGKKIPTGQDIQQVEQLLIKYFDSYIMNTMFENLEKSNPDAELNFMSKNHAIFRQEIMEVTSFSMINLSNKCLAK